MKLTKIASAIGIKAIQTIEEKETADLIKRHNSTVWPNPYEQQALQPLTNLGISLCVPYDTPERQTFLDDGPEPQVLTYEHRSVSLGAFKKQGNTWVSEIIDLGFTIPAGAMFKIIPTRLVNKND